VFIHGLRNLPPPTSAKRRAVKRSGR